ncbi:glycoside hydrolase family 26 protein [Hymenobacter sp. GOD-10R]|uniref:glycoside hydrolase family 26 protein n=1 Tax=Hymenobacter sp. GOD-10R TaxID=3093922 RepID=UPI002D77CBF6|nr:glycosyl hydrolase [Hymenobacter sp. GOD-10R]WRQ29347.1 glycosyl hydrolase [Hymenobacter sp. GOD-10R]
MKVLVYRTSAVLLVIIAGVLLSSLLLFAGERSKGPLEDLATTVTSDVARFEKQLVGGDLRKSRSAALGWFARYRTNKALLNAPDTILTGAYDNNTAESYESIVALEESLQVKLPIIQLYTAWGSKKDQVFPMLRAQAIQDLGSLPMITWEPWLDDFDRTVFPTAQAAERVNEGGLKAIAAGRYDAYVDKWATAAKQFGAPFYLRFGHEMNDPYRYPWGPQNNDPADYIAAWRHVVSRFRQLGATNAIWLWSPHPAYTNYREFYPGNEYVDWIGVTTLNYGTVAPAWSKWYSFDEIFGNSYAEFSQYGKPIIVTEFGSLRVGGDRAAWFQQALTDLPVKYPAVKAVVFYNNSSDMTTTYKSLDWSFNADKKVLTAATQAMKSWRVHRSPISRLLSGKPLVVAPSAARPDQHPLGK